MPFQPFNKIARLNRNCTITEKIDGTNASVEIVSKLAVDPGADGLLETMRRFVIAEDAEVAMLAGSRTRYITPTDDNMGFAKWVEANAEQLLALGPGRHYGEWWGQKIQRTYGLTEKRFSLFNVSRWHAVG